VVSVDVCLSIDAIALGDLPSLLLTLAEESCVDDRGKVAHDSFLEGMSIGAEAFGGETAGITTDTSFSTISSSSCSSLAIKKDAQSSVLGILCSSACASGGGTRGKPAPVTVHAPLSAFDSVMVSCMGAESRLTTVLITCRNSLGGGSSGTLKLAEALWLILPFIKKTGGFVDFFLLFRVLFRELLLREGVDILPLLCVPCIAVGVAE
jgi:hypothetical protein